MRALYDAVLLDRDGTLIVDVPYNGDPAKVRAMPGARAALDRLRAAGLRLGVVTNQSGLARGRFTAGQLAAVNARVEELLGPFGTWQICPHDDTAGCSCRKPAPGLVHAAAAALGTVPQRCVMIGDIGRDVAAALAAGATAILVPTAVTLTPELAAAPAVAPDLPAAADLILTREALVRPSPRPEAKPIAARPEAKPIAARAEVKPIAARPGKQLSAARAGGEPSAARAGDRAGTVLVVRADSAGDVLVTGPAIRAVAAGAERVVLLCGPRGRAAAGLLPGVDEIVEARLPWIDPDPEPAGAALVAALTARLAATGADEAVIFTSYHQSALPLALLLRAAGVARITAISEDYPGSLLDVRHRGVPAGVPEAERARSIAAAAGFALPESDDGTLRVTTGAAKRSGTTARGKYIVVHPGASVPARSCPPETMRAVVAALAAAGYEVVVTGGPDERDLAARVAAGDAIVAEPMSLADLATLLAGAACVVVANTGPAHLAAAAGTPVVSLFAPTVPFGQWGPYRVPVVRLGDAAAPCRDTRATVCPVAGHPCLTGITPAGVLAALRQLGIPPPAAEQEQQEQRERAEARAKAQSKEVAA